jgi:hypothetical protein
MELISINQNQIKINRTIFNMDPRIEKTTKISRNVDSGQTQLQQMGTLILTLLRLEAIRSGAYERWQPYFNEGHLDFPGLLAYLNVFHNDQNIIQKLEKYFSLRQNVLMKLKKDRSNPKLVQRLQDTKNQGLELMEELRSKIYSLQFTAEQFQTQPVH